MCDSCDHLVQKGGTWKYYRDKRGYFVRGFDIPPEYCKAYKPREETKVALEGESRNGKKHE